MRIVMDEKERRAEEERQQQLQQVHRQQQKLQNEIESLTTKLQQRKQELRELQQQAAPLTHRAKVRTIAQLRDHVLTDMITRTLYESDVPMTTGEIYEQICDQMEEHAKGGQNPRQAIGSTLASGSRYQAVERGLYQLTDEARAQVAKAMEE